MIAVLQRVTRGKVEVASREVGSIERGLVVLLGIARGDSESDVLWMSRRIASLRIFSDDAGKMNLNVQQVDGAILLVSQFTLLADLSSGNRPGFTAAEEPDIARIRCGEVAAQLLERRIRIAHGEFGANMLVTLENDGPVTIVLDSKTQLKSVQSD